MKRKNFIIVLSSVVPAFAFIKSVFSTEATEVVERDEKYSWEEGYRPFLQKYEAYWYGISKDEEEFGIAYTFIPPFVQEDDVAFKQKVMDICLQLKPTILKDIANVQRESKFSFIFVRVGYMDNFGNNTILHTCRSVSRLRKVWV